MSLSKQKLREDEVRKKVMQLIQETENNHNFKVIFAGETGSRAYELHTEASDIDVKGLFMYSEDQYLEV